jgi:hypothetical protein
MVALKTTVCGGCMKEWRYERGHDDGVHCVHAHVWGPSVSIRTSGNLDDTEADMRLIAAAPDLLAALKQCLDPCMGLYAHQDQLGHKCACYGCTKQKAANAIEKALGPIEHRKDLPF